MDVLGLLEVFFEAGGKRYPIGVEKGGAMERDKREEEMREIGSQ